VLEQAVHAGQPMPDPQEQKAVVEAGILQSEAAVAASKQLP
jgi:hypothetical protein